MDHKNFKNLTRPSLKKKKNVQHKKFASYFRGLRSLKMHPKIKAVSSCAGNHPFFCCLPPMPLLAIRVLVYFSWLMWGWGPENLCDSLTEKMLEASSGPIIPACRPLLLCCSTPADKWPLATNTEPGLHPLYKYPPRSEVSLRINKSTECSSENGIYSLSLCHAPIFHSTSVSWHLLMPGIYQAQLSKWPRPQRVHWLMEQ